MSGTATTPEEIKAGFIPEWAAAYIANAQRRGFSGALTFHFHQGRPLRDQVKVQLTAKDFFEKPLTGPRYGD